LKVLPVDRSHKHSDEVNGVSAVREIRMLRLTWRGLETWFFECAHQSSTLPVGEASGNRCLYPELHHCHLKKGRPTYIAVWEINDKEIKLVEVTYVGTHEKAPY